MYGRKTPFGCLPLRFLSYLFISVLSEWERRKNVRKCSNPTLTQEVEQGGTAKRWRQGGWTLPTKMDGRSAIRRDIAPIRLLTKVPLICKGVMAVSELKLFPRLPCQVTHLRHFDNDKDKQINDIQIYRGTAWRYSIQGFTIKVILFKVLK